MKQSFQNACIGRYSPVYPHRRARSAGIRTVAADISLSKSAHSHTSKYILSPLAATLLCKAMRRSPTERGRYLWNDILLHY